MTSAIDEYHKVNPGWGDKLTTYIPIHMQENIAEYILYGIPRGDFLTAILSNDFMQAAIRADEINLHYLRNYALFLYNAAPIGCWGSPENVQTWIKQGGLIGRQRRHEQQEQEQQEQESGGNQT